MSDTGMIQNISTIAGSMKGSPSRTAQGKMNSMVAAFKQGTGQLMVFVDDDNVLDPDYLAKAVEIERKCPFLGTWSGRIELKLEDPTNPPPERLRHLLCERLVDAPSWSNDPYHIASTPWGAGMCIRRTVAQAYVRATETNPKRLQLDLQGNRLGYGGDTDVAYTGCSMGLGMGVFPQLRITHLIPKRRCTVPYLIENLRAHAYSEVLHHWVLTGTLPPKRSDVRARIGNWARWFAADSLGRKIIEATERSQAEARERCEAGE